MSFFARTACDTFASFPLSHFVSGAVEPLQPSNTAVQLPFSFSSKFFAAFPLSTVQKIIDLNSN
jgi:hypothetical protein